MDALEQELPPLQAHIAQRMALEGIPVRAIARSLKQDAGLIYDTLEAAQQQAIIIDMPKDDWPPTAKRADHAPAFKPGLRDDDLAFACRQVFKLTPLQAAFMVALLKNSRVDKTKFHILIENLRNNRLDSQPSDKEPTAPKMVDVVICHLRKRLKKVDQGIEINTNWGDGYFIKTDCRSYVLKKYFQQQEETNGGADTA